MICNKCGKENSNINRLCSFCGNQLVFEQINPNYQNIVSNKKSKNWIFIVIGLIIGIPIFLAGLIFTVALIIVLVESANDPFDGNWVCSPYSDLNNYSITVNFDNDDSRFTIYKYGDEINNYITGEYDYNEIKDEVGSYYGLGLYIDKYIINGKVVNNENIEFVVDFSEDNNQMMMTSNNKYNQYYCIKR